MATVINVEEADIALAGLYERVTAGEEIVLARATGPNLKIVVERTPLAIAGKRQPGTLKGMIKEAPGVWDPMTDDELREIGLL